MHKEILKVYIIKNYFKLNMQNIQLQNINNMILYAIMYTDTSELNLVGI